MDARFRPMTIGLSAIILGILAGTPLPRASALDGVHSRDTSLFSIDEYKQHITYLASDELEGRGTGQPGNDRAAAYIADEFKRLGVEPAGDDNTYFQKFTLALKREIAAGTQLAFSIEGRRTRIPLVLNEDFRPFPFSKSRAFKGGVVFAGYGIVDDDQNYNDYDGVDVTDQIVLVIRRSPRFADFDTAVHQTFRAKASRANARGAAALLIVNRPGDEEEGLYPFESAPGGFGGVSYGLPMIHLTESAADELLAAAKMPTLKQLADRIDESKKPAPAELTGVSIRGEVDIQPIESPVQNVVGLIPGKGPQADEIIILGAHYDHLGIRNKGEPNFDPAKDISNGADDNASGTSLIMTMARVYTGGQAPNRSILLMLFTGEELGLLGSAHFAKHPTVDLSRCVAMLNFDMVGRLKNDRLEVGGMRTGDFQDLVDRLGDEYGFEIRDGGGGRGPSDHTSFYNKKIPVLFFFTGIHRQYHRPEDDTPLINFEGAIRIARFSADIIDDIDARAERPTFQEDTRRAAITRQSDNEEPGRAAKDRKDPSRDRAVAEAPSPAGGVRLGIVPDTDDEEGVIVSEIESDSPAKQAGVQEGDRIVRIGKLDVRTIEDALDAVSKLQRGDETTLGIVRKGKSLELKIRFAQRRGKQRDSADSFGGLSGHLGKVVKRLSEDQESGEKVLDFKIENDGNLVTVIVRMSNAEGGWAILGALAEALPAALDSEEVREHGTKVAIRVEWPGAAISVTIDNGSEQKKAAGHASPRGDSPHGPKHGVTGKPAGPSRADAAHGDDSAEASETMPSVRLGIMPTYGEGEGGEAGYEIDGVVEGGPAAAAGMKDHDRIYMIGSKKITNVYEYMDALRQYKPGDEVPVTILRDGKKIDLKVKAAGAKTDAA